MALPRQRRLFTPEEYLKLERAADYKSEYVDGEIFAMAGAKFAHNKICLRIAYLLEGHLENRNCDVLVAEMRVAINPRRIYTYPDVTVVCEPVFFDPSANDNLVNPRVIFEVLSPSTEAYDRGQKFEHYKRIPSLTDYVLVAQDRALVEHFRRSEAGRWHKTEYRGLDAILELDSIGCRLPLSSIYHRVLDR